MSLLTADHPRLRGEHDCLPGPVAGVRWIIPACAGSTITSDNLGDRCDGSSPPARGARSSLHLPHRMQGIIPACAGSTLTLISEPFFSRDHPRLRGEHDSVGLTVTSPPGSSPPARGAHFLTSKNTAVSGDLESLFVSHGAGGSGWPYSSHGAWLASLRCPGLDVAATVFRRRRRDPSHVDGS